MLRLLTSCWSQEKNTEESRRSVTLIIIGLENSGKSVLSDALQRLLPTRMEKYMQSDLTTLLLNDCNVYVYDLNGDPKSRELWPNYYAQAHGIVFVLDSSDLERMHEVKIILPSVLSDPRVAGKPILLLANKQDKTGALLTEDIAKHLLLERLVKETKSMCRVESCSAIINFQTAYHQSIIEGVRWLLATIGDKYEELCTRQQQYEVGISSTLSNRICKGFRRLTGRRYFSRFYTRLKVSKNKRLDFSHHSGEVKPLKPILQKEGLRIRPKKNISVTFALDEPVEEEECSVGSKDQNATGLHCSQKDNCIPAAYIDDYLFEDPIEGKIMDPWEIEGLLLDNSCDDSLSICDF
ncbi:ADP-ribosylation factor-like protein 13A [Echinops telfairi]|uniref:ADP-ribosylation factor-like protein 13A n=1 Tax=Echinops telfairi TaxID=9371 RepID=A0AC55D450_ECHTE|nr:ADP-ribosylation factor-like protein 13A [Echinops telfairi]